MALSIRRRRNSPKGHLKYRLEDLSDLCMLQPRLLAFRLLLLSGDGRVDIGVY